MSNNQKKRGVLIFLDNFILPLHEGIMHYAKLTKPQQSFIIKSKNNNKRKKQIKIDINNNYTNSVKNLQSQQTLFQIQNDKDISNLHSNTNFPNIYKESMMKKINNEQELEQEQEEKEEGKKKVEDKKEQYFKKFKQQNNILQNLHKNNKINKTKKDQKQFSDDSSSNNLKLIKTSDEQVSNQEQQISHNYNKENDSNKKQHKKNYNNNGSSALQSFFQNKGNLRSQQNDQQQQQQQQFSQQFNSNEENDIYSRQQQQQIQKQEQYGQNQQENQGQIDLYQQQQQQQQYKYPEFEVIGIVKKQLGYDLPLSGFQQERCYYNYGIKIKLEQSDQDPTKFKILPTSLTPFVKLKKIQKNSHFSRIRDHPGIPLKLDNQIWKPPNLISVDELDFIIHDGVKLFMCEYEERIMDPDSFNYIVNNLEKIQKILNIIAERTGFQWPDDHQSSYQQFHEYMKDNNKQYPQQQYKLQVKQQQQTEIEEEEEKQVQYCQNNDLDYSKVVWIQQQIFVLFNHFDQKFFYRSKSVEWTDKKYNFIAQNAEKQIQFLEKLGNSLKY